MNHREIPPEEQREFERMMRRFKKDTEKSGILLDLKRKECFIKPSTIRHIKDVARKHRLKIEKKKKEIEISKGPWVKKGKKRNRRKEEVKIN